jgi:AraC-like DNA-binding protein
MPAGVRFGAMSIALLIFAVQALILAGALLSRPVNRRANAYLAALLAVIAGMLTPFIIGYAGFYDAWPWLSFAPFAVPLAVGPLLYGHVRASLVGERLTWPHLALPAAQFAYQAVCFTLPLETKDWIDTTFQEPFLTPVTSIAVVMSMGGYAVAGLALIRRAKSDGVRRAAALSRLKWAVTALLILVAARAAYDLYDAVVAPLDYFDLFAFYVLLSIVATFLGVEGWRAAAEPLPRFATEERDWPTLARGWEAELRRSDWWRDPDLDLSALARKLGTNTSYLSRALNEGLGLGFADLVGGIRAEAVAQRIAAGAREDLLELALDAGFGSKASFNRAFARRFGCSPSAFRKASTAQKASFSTI